MKRVKCIGIAVATLIIIAILIAMILPYVISVEQYKSQLERLIYKQTGRHFVIDGPVTWQLFPSAKLSIGKGEMANPTDFKSDQAFLTYQSATATMDLFAFISGQVKIDSLTINDAYLDLQQEPDGHNNWGFASENPPQTSQANSGSKEQQATQQKKTQSNKQSDQLSFYLNTIRLNNLKINYFNGDVNRFITFKHLNIQLDNARMPLKYHIDTHFSTKYIQSASAVGSGAIELHGTELSLNQVVHQFNIITGDYGNYHVNLSGDLTYKADKEVIDSTVNVYVLNLLNAYFRDIHYDIQSSEFNLHAIIDNAQEAELLSRFDVDLPSSNTSDPNVIWDVHGLHLDMTGDSNACRFDHIHGNIGRVNISGDYNIESIKPFKSDFNLKAKHLYLDDYVELNGLRLFFKNIWFKGNLSRNSNVFDGDVNVTSKIAELKGLDINESAKKFQQFLESLVSAKDVGYSFNQLKSELVSLNNLGAHINDNERSTQLYDLQMKNQIRTDTLYTKAFRWHGKEFTLDGSGQINLSDQVLNYLLHVYVYNQADKNLKAYQKTFIPVIFSGKLGDVKFSINRQGVEKQLQPIFQQAMKNVVQDKAANFLNHLTH